MKGRVIIGYSLACLVLTLVFCVETTTAQGRSPSSPVPVGIPVVTTVECGTGYSSLELYDARLTLLEIVRGEKAWNLIKEASVFNKPPKVGFEYIVARIRFEFFKRGFPGDKNYELREDQFTAVSISGREYEAPSVLPLKPRLSGTLSSGKSLEGWVTLLVPKEDNKPLMNFDREHDGGIWFQLY